MSERNNSLCNALGLSGNSTGAVECGTCISIDKIYDAVKDKECLEDLRVFVNECGQDAIDRANNIRVKNAEVLNVCITVNEVAFNRGYYSVNIRYYFKITFEACIPGGRAVEFCGIAVYDKTIVLFGGEGSVSIFTSDRFNDSVCCDCSTMHGEHKTNLPKVVLEVAPPVSLGVKLVEKTYNYGCCCCDCSQLPENVTSCVDGSLVDDYGTKNLYVTLGIFSVIRMERPCGILVNALDYCVPERDSTQSADTTNPCELFKSMAFPGADFCPPAPPCCSSGNCNGNSSVGGTNTGGTNKKCGC